LKGGGGRSHGEREAAGMAAVWLLEFED
jgi:hypothetical protein